MLPVHLYSKNVLYHSGLIAHLRNVLRVESLYRYNSLHRLELRIQQSTYDLGVVIVCISRQEELLRMVLKRSLYQDIRLVLFLVIDSPEALQLAHRLYPRFIYRFKNNWSGFFEICKRIILNSPEGALNQIKEA